MSRDLRLSDAETENFLAALTHYGSQGLLTVANCRSMATGDLEPLLIAVQPLPDGSYMPVRMAVIMRPDMANWYSPPTDEDNGIEPEPSIALPTGLTVTTLD